MAWNAGKITVEAGQTAKIQGKATRLWPKFTDELTVQPLSFPGQFKLDNFNIAAGQSEANVKIQVQPDTQPGE